MSMLARYRKQQNGFEQLLQLIESSNAKKQETFFRLIDQEDRSWGALLRTKLLTIERLFAWEDSTVRVVLGLLPARLFAIALHDNPELIERTLPLFNELRREEMQFELKKRQIHSITTRFCPSDDVAKGSRAGQSRSDSP